MKFQEGDIVLIHYNNSIGHIEKIHPAPMDTLHDIRGEDGALYPNQLEKEISLRKSWKIQYICTH